MPTRPISIASSATGDWLYNVQLSGSTAYGTNLAEIREAIGQGLVCVHSIYPGPDGAAALRRAFGAQLYSVALLPPGDSLDARLAVLRDRLLARNRDSAEALEQRLLHQSDALEFIAENPAVPVGADRHAGVRHGADQRRPRPRPWPRRPNCSSAAA